jgi:hypothetical protein
MAGSIRQQGVIASPIYYLGVVVEGSCEMPFRDGPSHPLAKAIGKGDLKSVLAVAGGMITGNGLMFLRVRKCTRSIRKPAARPNL